MKVFLIIILIILLLILLIGIFSALKISSISSKYEDMYFKKGYKYKDDEK